MVSKDFRLQNERKNKVQRGIGKKKGKSLRKGKVLPKTSRIVSYIHVGDAGKDDLQSYLAGVGKHDLQVFSQEDLPDLDSSDIINGLDQVGTAVDFCDDAHRCSRACPVGCQGHLRPNEVIIYEGVDMNGCLVQRKKYKARFILKEQKANLSAKKRKMIKKCTSTEVVPSSQSEIQVGERMPEKYRNIFLGEPLEKTVIRDHGWNPRDKSYNLTMKTSEHLTIRRQPVTQSTDAVRGKKGHTRGVFVYEICWPIRMRGTHAVVGVATREAPLHAYGYKALIGSNTTSWGWDIGRKESLHNGTVTNYPAAVRNHYQWTAPEQFYLIMDMDEGTVSFALKDMTWLGVAFSNIRGDVLYPAISTVWGHAEISISFVGSSLNHSRPSINH